MVLSRKWKGTSQGEEAARPHMRDAFLLPLTIPGPTLHTNHRHTAQTPQLCAVHLHRGPAGAGCRFCTWWSPVCVSFSSSSLASNFFFLEGCALDGQTGGRLDPCSSIGVRLLVYQTCLSATVWCRATARRTCISPCPIERARGKRLRVALGWPERALSSGVGAQAHVLMPLSLRSRF